LRGLGCLLADWGAFFGGLGFMGYAHRR
jgi:hypothetical protein